MIHHLPEWIVRRYAKLWFKFKEREFTKGQVEKILKGDKAVAVFLSDLRKYGWIEIKVSQKDARNTIYKLKEPTKTFMEELRELSKQ